MNKRNRRLMAGLRRQRVGNGPAREQGVQWMHWSEPGLGGWLRDYNHLRDIILKSMGIPPDLIKGDGNYSSTYPIIITYPPIMDKP